MYRNGLVLALHALACVAGFIAGSQLPTAAQDYRGLVRKLHEAAAPPAIAFVAAATLFSLGTQAYALGNNAATMALQLGSRRSSCWSRCCRTPCPSCSRSSSRWPLFDPQPPAHVNELLAATLVTTAIAIPLLLLPRASRRWVTPSILSAIS